MVLQHPASVGYEFAGVPLAPCPLLRVARPYASQSRPAVRLIRIGFFCLKGASPADNVEIHSLAGRMRENRAFNFNYYFFFFLILGTAYRFYYSGQLLFGNYPSSSSRAFVPHPFSEREWVRVFFLNWVFLEAWLLNRN